MSGSGKERGSGGPHGRGEREWISRGGIRFIGLDTRWQAREESSNHREPSLHPGPPHTRLFAASFLVASLRPPASPVDEALEIVSNHLSEGRSERVRLQRDTPVQTEVTAYSGIRWQVARHPSGWDGELLWRTPHLVRAGTPLTLQLALEERASFTRLWLAVTGDIPIDRRKASILAGQARPSLIPLLASRLRMEFHGRPPQPTPLPEFEIEAFAQDTILGRSREHPVAVLSPEEDGAFVLDSDHLAAELLGIAQLRVIERPAHTFRLTDAMGGKALSCFGGALRLYLPGCTLSDDPYAHPLLLPDRLTDPILRMGDYGKVQLAVAGGVQIPELFPEAEPEPVPELVSKPGPDPATDSATDPTPKRPADPPKGASAGPDSSPPVRPQPSTTGEAPVAFHRQGDGSQGEAPHPAPPSPAPKGGAQTEPAWWTAVQQGLEQVDRTLERLASAHETLVDEVRTLRSLSTLRAARTKGLERRLQAIEARLEEKWGGRDDAQTAVEDAAALREATSDTSPELDAAPTLPGVVEAARARYGDGLLILDSAVDAARESPFLDPEEVEAVLEIMAQVAQRRGDGLLDAGLKDAFRGYGVDYRGGISPNTSRRLRQQYQFKLEDGTPVECVEHIVLGSTYDPRRCLRIYFTSRYPGETRFIVGHVGRHFEVGTST